MNLNPLHWRLTQFDSLLRDVRAIRNALELGPPLPTPSQAAEAPESSPRQEIQALEVWVQTGENDGLTLQRWIRQVEDRLDKLTSRLLEAWDRLEQAARRPVLRGSCPCCFTLLEVSPQGALRLAMPVSLNPSGKPSPLSKPASPMLGQTRERGTSAGVRREECSSTD